MSTFTKNQRKFASVLLSVALVSFGISAGPAQAIDNRPACGPDTDGVTVCEGATTDGAKYAIQVPEEFNGTVFLYSHGYQYSVDLPPQNYTTAQALDNPMVGPDEMVNQTLLAQGYALAGSTFPVLGWNAAEAVKTNVELIGVVKKAFKDTKKVIVFQHNNQIHIYKCEEDLEEGTAVNMNNEENQENVDPSDIEVSGAEVVTPTDEQ
jgi:hypothetical protein